MLFPKYLIFKSNKKLLKKYGQNFLSCKTSFIKYFDELKQKNISLKKIINILYMNFINNYEVNFI